VALGALVLVKFRTMGLNTVSSGTHLAAHNSGDCIWAVFMSEQVDGLLLGSKQ
jgi:hypothetical protein